MLKLVKALDLQHWADTKESEALMPELMRRLVHASLKEITYVVKAQQGNVQEIDAVHKFVNMPETLNKGVSHGSI